MTGHIPLTKRMCDFLEIPCDEVYGRTLTSQEFEVVLASLQDKEEGTDDV